MLFSQRYGLKPIKMAIQIDCMDDDLRNGLWNCLIVSFFRPLEDDFISRMPRVKDLNEHGRSFIERLWHDFFKMPIDSVPPHYSGIYAYIRNYCFQGSYGDVYDILEWIAQNHYDSSRSDTFMSECNQTLEKEVSGYRFVDDKIVLITSDEEIAAVEEAVKIPNPFGGPRAQIKSALKKLSDRKSPDYAGSIKDSISAVEGTLTIITRRQVTRFADALGFLKKKRIIDLHPALGEAFKKMYGYTSNTKQGIRHALLEEPNLTSEDAKYMLVVCSAFINYLITKVSKGQTNP